MFEDLNGPAKQDSISVTASTPVRVKVSTNELPERKVVTIQPLTGSCRVYFADEGETPVAATVLNKGFKIRKEGTRTFEATETQKVWIISETGTISIIIAERS
jgi:hypothetical protein